jgi:hypothetical protein
MQSQISVNCFFALLLIDNMLTSEAWICCGKRLVLR